MLVAGLSFLIAAIGEKSSLRLKFAHSHLIAAVIFCAVLGNAALFVAYAKAPNLAYAIAIDNSRIIILFLAGLAMFSQTWSIAKALGIVLTFAGILLLA